MRTSSPFAAVLSPSRLAILLQPTVASITHSYASLQDFTLTVTASNALSGVEGTLDTSALIDVEERITAIDFAPILLGECRDVMPFHDCVDVL